MKLFRTGSVDMVTECQKMFNFLPLKYQVDIRTASFMLRFISSENTVCHLFVSHAALTLNIIYSRYGGSIDSIHSLKDAIVSPFCNFWLFLSVMFVLLCIRMYVCVYVCMFVCMCINVYHYYYCLNCQFVTNKRWIL